MLQSFVLQSSTREGKCVPSSWLVSKAQGHFLLLSWLCRLNSCTCPWTCPCDWTPCPRSWTNPCLSCVLCPQSGRYLTILFVSSLSWETDNYYYEFLVPLVSDDKKLPWSSWWGPLLLSCLPPVSPVLVTPPLPSVISSLFSFYLLPAWTPVPGVL